MTIETKYNIGDEVWVAEHFKAMRGVIEGINVEIRQGDKLITYELECRNGHIWEGIFSPPKKSCLRVCRV